MGVEMPWGSTMTVGAYEDSVEMVEEAIRFAEFLGITQVDLMGEILFDEPLEEYLTPLTRAAGDTVLPTTLEDRALVW